MRYLNEFAIRSNEGNVKIDSMDRMRALGEKTIGKPLTYEAPIARQAAWKN